MTKGWFVTGTDTGVGKTLVATGLLTALAQQGLRVVGMKPVASGCCRTGPDLRNEDAELLQRTSSVDADYADINPYAFEPAVAPHLAAKAAGIAIELQTILDHFEKLQAQSDVVVVEGVGGWMVPLGRVITTEHLAKSLGLPVILVVGMRLGCLNHALLTAGAIRAAGLPLAGWVANMLSSDMDLADDNIATLKRRLHIPFVGLISYLSDPKPDAIVDSLALATLLETHKKPRPED